MEGISSSMTSALSSLTSAQTGSEVQVKVLKEAMDQAEKGVLPLIDQLGGNVDLRA